MVRKTYKFPRRFSRTYCMKKPCGRMGFTEKASCRPYKNCYKGGAASKKQKKSSSTRAHTHKVNHPKFFYTSEHTSMTSHPMAGEPYGKRTVVSVENGRGSARVEELDRTGRASIVNEKPLKKSEIKEITRGNFVPGLLAGV